MNSWNRILELFFPTRCAFCHRLSPNGEPVCGDCRKRLPYTKELAEKHFSGLSSCFSPFFYTGDVRRSLLRYKFGGRSMYAEVYGEFLSKCIDENKISCDSITWVPLSRQRLRRRGYDQARLLAEDLAGRQGIVCEPLLRKRRNNRPQSTAGGPEKRRRNVKNAYELLPDACVVGKRILLVDDIVTTGATLSECAGVLRRAGAAQVLGLSLARAND